MLGFHLFLREYATVADMIGFTPIHDGEHGRLLRMGLEPQRFLRAETCRSTARKRRNSVVCAYQEHL